MEIYICPMHPEVVRDKPGMCPECGMSLIKTKSVNRKAQNKGDNHNILKKHEGHQTNVFKAKFWVSLFLSVPVVLYSDIVQKLLDWQAPQFPGSDYLQLVLASVIFFYGGLVFLQSAYREIRGRMPGMMTLIAMAISVAYIYSIYAEVLGKGGTLWWELATLITIMLLGHWMEMRAVGNAQGALKELSKLLPDRAEVIRSEKTLTLSLQELRSGDLVLVKPGGKIPADGVVEVGSSDVNESLATGESKPVAKQKGSEVIAGTINGDGSLKVRVTKIGDETFLAGVMRLVREAQASKSKLQLLSDKAAYYLTIIAVVTGTITFAAWIAYGSTDVAIERMVAVLVIACPHALGLAIPLVASISTTKAANNGFLVKQRMALEAARGVDVVLFDKTGTLTKGEFGVESIIPKAGQSADGVLRLAASVNFHSEHPLAKALVNEARVKGVKLQPAIGFERIAGRGAKGKIDGQEVYVGSPSLVEELGVVRRAENEQEEKRLSQEGKTVVYVIAENQLVGSIALGDIVRNESKEAIKQLKDMGIRSAMITGDSEEVASWVAKELGLDEYFAKVLPEQKAEKVKFLQAKGQKVAMVGDGINDAPALTQADLGIAIGAGTNVAIESAGIILVKNDPRDIVKIIRLSKMTYMKMIQNLFWATGYNVIAIPLAAGILASKGVVLQPAVAAALMSLSTVIVAVNAVTLKRRPLD